VARGAEAVAVPPRLSISEWRRTSGIVRRVGGEIDLGLRHFPKLTSCQRSPPVQGYASLAASNSLLINSATETPKAFANFRIVASERFSPCRMPRSTRLIVASETPDSFASLSFVQLWV